jgi:C_GCAxxG_C_C family probable redox protein
MWEAYGLENEELLWTGVGFFGGIGGYQKAPCGAVSASAICLGLRHRCSADDEEKVRQAKWDASQKMGKIVRSFAEKFGTIICQDLIGFDFSDREAARRFFESGESENKCNNYVQFIIEKLYELDEE